MVQPLWKNYGQLLIEPNTLSASDPAIMFMGIYPHELKTMSTYHWHMDVIAALFIIAQTWKQPQCLLVGE